MANIDNQEQNAAVGLHANEEQNPPLIGRLRLELGFANVKDKLDGKLIFREFLASFISVATTCFVASMSPSEAQMMAETAFKAAKGSPVAGSSPAEWNSTAVLRPDYARHIAVSAGSALGSLLPSFAMAPHGGAFGHCVMTWASVLYDGYDAGKGFWCLVAQFPGSYAACFLLKYLLHPHTCPTIPISPYLSLWRAICIETFITALATFQRLMIFTSQSTLGDVRGFVMSGAYFATTLTGSFWTGGSTNPYRSICASMVSGRYDYWKVYQIGPNLGGLIGGLAFQVIVRPQVASGYMDFWNEPLNPAYWKKPTNNNPNPMVPANNDNPDPVVPADNNNVLDPEV